MGYCMNIVGCDFKMKKEHFQEALKALKAKGKKTTDPHETWWYEEIKNLTHFDSVLRTLSWEPDYDSEGNINSICFYGEKSTSEDAWFEAISPFVTAGSYIEMQGEGGELWRWVFDGEKCKEIHPKIDWSDKLECADHCPKCGADANDIDWDVKEWEGNTAWQNATCEKCGCKFTEIYEYSHTEIDEPVEEPE